MDPAFLLILIAPVLVMLVARPLVDFRRRWPPRIAVLVAGALPALVAVAITRGLAFFLSPVIAFYGLIPGAITHAVLRPQ